MDTILVAIDFSDATDSVVTEAESLALNRSAQVRILHVEPPEPAFIGYEPGPQHVRDQVAAEAKADHGHLHELRDRMKAKGIDADVLLIQGPAIEKILSEADRLKASYIVIGSHGHGRLFDLLVGSVSEGVIRGAPCPVLLVPIR